MSRLAGEGKAAWAETSCTSSVPSGQDQTQGKDTPAAWPVSVSGRWQRDSAGQVGSIELLGARTFIDASFGSGPLVLPGENGLILSGAGQTVWQASSGEELRLGRL